MPEEFRGIWLITTPLPELISLPVILCHTVKQLSIDNITRKCTTLGASEASPAFAHNTKISPL